MHRTLYQPLEVGRILDIHPIDTNRPFVHGLVAHPLAVHRHSVHHPVIGTLLKCYVSTTNASLHVLYKVYPVHPPLIPRNPIPCHHPYPSNLLIRTPPYHTIPTLPFHKLPLPQPPKPRPNSPIAHSVPPNPRTHHTPLYPTIPPDRRPPRQTP